VLRKLEALEKSIERLKRENEELRNARGLDGTTVERFEEFAKSRELYDQQDRPDLVLGKRPLERLEPKFVILGLLSADIQRLTCRTSFFFPARIALPGHGTNRGYLFRSRPALARIQEWVTVETTATSNISRLRTGWRVSLDFAPFCLFLRYGPD
jgi:hypothetical protein